MVQQQLAELQKEMADLKRETAEMLYMHYLRLQYEHLRETRGIWNGNVGFHGTAHDAYHGSSR
eukprot:3295930-Rhodomonas_salina.1